MQNTHACVHAHKWAMDLWGCSHVKESPRGAAVFEICTRSFQSNEINEKLQPQPTLPGESTSMVSEPTLRFSVGAGWVLSKK